MKKILIPILIFSFQYDLFAETIVRKRLNILFSPWVIHKNLEEKARIIESSKNIQLLYGVTNNLFLGANYSIGLKAEKDIQDYISIFSRNIYLYQSSYSKRSETFSLNTQYFIWSYFYGSVNIGIEKGLSINRDNFTTRQDNMFIIEPISYKTIYSDRSFGSIGIGLKEQVNDWLLLALELQIGYIESGKINNHFTFYPGYLDFNEPSVVQSFLLSHLLSEKQRNSQFFQLFFSAGIAL